jgi:hypothetical protein
MMGSQYTLRLTNGFINTVRNMARARFEKIDENSNDAMLKREKHETGSVVLPATASGSRLSGDRISQRPGIGAIYIVRSIEGWHTHMWHSDVEERSWTV